MNVDGSDIHPIAVNTNRDNEQAVLPDGRIVFSRLEVFYSRLKTELTIHAVEPDGTHDTVLHGPERRRFWQTLDVGPRGDDYAANTPPMRRILRLTQPQGMPDGRVICSTQGGLTIIGRGRYREWIIPHDKRRAFTTPFPLADGRVLCASTLKAKKPADVGLALYIADSETGELTLLYNDPKSADYEARPIMLRELPPSLSESPARDGFIGRLLCISAHKTQEPNVAKFGQLVRIIERLPLPSRHSTQTNRWEVRRKHHGTLARVLGTLPLAADGSFFVEAPADRILHFQILDSDRRVLGNQLTWIYARPGETRTYIGCHERPDTTPSLRAQPQALWAQPVRCLPTDD